ncbi:MULTISPECIES: hypothetical protein [unclassified Sphingomonas]|uniref:hypothetical protein n=1 Tax=unclassified Sphingomonas TaxID=196159 RepID=UPI00226A50D3|nr:MULTISPECIES: hypothetical protein [unclassified Sphingomonas]
MYINEELRKKVITLKIKSSTISFSSEAYYDDFNRALDGRALGKIYVIPAEPGSGKSRGLQQYLRKYRDGGFKPADTGVLIVVTRLAEMKNYIGGAGLVGDEFAVMTADTPVASAFEFGGSINADRAPILFVTAQMIQSRCRGRFADASEFYYKGKPRRLRVWDEDFFVADAVIISGDDFGELMRPLRGSFDTLANEIEHLEDRLRRMPPGSEVVVPQSISAAASAALMKLVGLSDSQKRVLEALRCVAGQTCRVSVVSYGVPAIVGQRSRLPDDIAPLFVLDASARVSETYPIMMRAGVPIELMPYAPLSYSSATFYHLRRGAGRTAIANPAVRASLIAEAAAVINAAPGDDHLVVYNRVNGVDLPKELKLACKGAGGVEFLYWGDHRAKNDYRHIRRVVCVGLLRFPEAGYDAQHLKSGGGLANRLTDVTALRDSELCSVMLQAFARSNMRNHGDLECGNCEIYIIDNERRLPSLLGRAFPGSAVQEWKPLNSKLAPRQSEILDHLLSITAGDLSKGINKSSVYNRLGIEKSNFSKLINDERFRTAAAKQGIIIEPRRFVRHSS